MTNNILIDVDRALHDEIHAAMMRTDPALLLDNPRTKVFSTVQHITGELYGTVADVGCGSAFASIWLGQNAPKVDQIDAIEGSAAAVEELIPRNIAHYNFGHKIHPYQGSFDDLTAGRYDFVIAFGSLHHSMNLCKTMDSICNSLKPGGYLIAQEPTMPDNTTHMQYQKKYDIVEKRFGLEIRNGDRFDRFFRECEYKSAAIHAGLDIVLWEDWERSSARRPDLKEALRSAKVSLAEAGVASTLKKVAGYVGGNNASKNSKQKWQTEMSLAKQQLRPKVFVAQKSENATIYHRD